MPWQGWVAGGLFLAFVTVPAWTYALVAIIGWCERRAERGSK